MNKGIGITIFAATVMANFVFLMVAINWYDIGILNTKIQAISLIIGMNFILWLINKAIDRICGVQNE